MGLYDRFPIHKEVYLRAWLRDHKFPNDRIVSQEYIRCIKTKEISHGRAYISYKEVSLINYIKYLLNI